MVGGRQLGWGIAGGLVGCAMTWPGVPWLAIGGGIAVAMVVGAKAASPATGRPAVQGAGAGALAAGIAWIGVVGAEVGIRTSDAVVSAGLSELAMTEPAGQLALAETVVDTMLWVPLLFWGWLLGGAFAGAVSAVGVHGRGVAASRRLPAPVAPILMLVGSVFLLVVTIGALCALFPHLYELVPRARADTARNVQLGSTFLLTGVFVTWTAWSAGARVRHRDPVVRTTGAMMAGLGLPVIALLPAMNVSTEVFSMTAILWFVAALSGIAGYRWATGDEPLPSAADGTREVLNAGLAAVILGFGALGGTIAIGLSLVAVVAIPPLLDGVPWSETTPMSAYLTELRHVHATLGAQGLMAAWVVLALFVFPAIAFQRRFGSPTRRGVSAP